jgi:DNA-binding NarL/FixJ family response regulator
MAENKLIPGFDPEAFLNEASVIRALVVDADEATLERLSQTLSHYPWISIIGEVKGLEETLAKINELHPHVIIMLVDNGIPAIDYDGVVQICDAQLPGCAIIMAEKPVRHVGLAIKAGATALLSKNATRHELVNTIHKAFFWSHCQPLPQ